MRRNTALRAWICWLRKGTPSVRALQDREYYAGRYRETHALRSQLAAELRTIGGVDVLEGATNSVLRRLPTECPSAEEVVERCRSHNLFIRNVGETSPAVGPNVVRAAVKDAETNRRIAAVLREVVGNGQSTSTPVEGIRLAVKG